MTVKSAPATARIVPPFSVYGLNCLCCGFAIADMSGMRKGRMRRNLQEKKREKE